MSEGKAQLATERPYQICTRCIMDTSDPEISFDDDGVCSHCHYYDGLASAFIWDEVTRKEKLDRLVDRIRVSGRGQDYDCIIGVSGGVDSTYTAYVVKEQLGLRPLAVHMDNGWNSSLAVRNIERTLNRLGIDLYTEVLDWEEFRDLQLAFLRASTPDSEIPSDHAITAVLMREAIRHGVKYIVTGSNFTTEAIMPAAWSQGIRDWKYIKAVQTRFGTRPIRTFPHFTMYEFIAFLTLRRKRLVGILDKVAYDRDEAMRLIQEDLGWVYYGGKHYESVYTRFFQAYILPRKFGADKRRGHLSTLVLSEQMTREVALAEMEQPICPPEQLQEDREFVIKKLGITADEFDRIMALEPKSFWDYPSYTRSTSFKLLRSVYRLPRRLRTAGRKSA